MARRIEVELTSVKDSETWTWRAAGARQPKGEVAANLLYPDASVGDVCKVEAEFHLDGIEVLEVFAPKAKKERDDLLELISRPLRDDELVTEVKAPKGRGRGRDGDRPRRDRSDRGDRKDRGAPSERGERAGSRPPRDRQPSAPQKPRPTRLKPRRVHRDAVVAEVPEEHRPIADQLLKGGLPAVRTAAKDDPNAKAIIAIAEGLQPKLATAEWRDRAEAAMGEIETLDLRDLRQVVVAADKGARDEETRAMAAELRESLNRRIEADHAEWLADLEGAVKEERTIRALRLTSRPVKAGSPIPVEIAEPLAAQTAAALGAETFPDRWASVVDALAFSPIRNAVTPEHYPELDEQSLDVVRAVSDRVPTIAKHYGIKPAEAKAAAKRVRAARKASGGRGRPGGRPSGGGDRPRGPRKEGETGKDPRGDKRGDKRGGDKRRDRDSGPKVNTGHADLLRKPSRPRPGTVVPEPEPEPEEVEASETADAEASAPEATEATEASESESAEAESPTEDAPAPTESDTSEEA